jgi:peptidoglycan/xylan/chitin deacetylase (PgdA/CDA1 family)
VKRIHIGLLALALLAAVLFWRARSAPLLLHPAFVPLTPLAHRQVDPLVDYPERFPLQIAVLWTVTHDGTVSPLALVHALKEMGLPFFITRDPARALTHQMVIIFPGVDSISFDEPTVQRLIEFVRGGGSIFAQNVSWNGIRMIFGYREVIASRSRYRVVFSVADPVTKYLNRPEERETRLGSEHYREIIWSHGYIPEEGAEAVARFEDGSAALLANSFGKGRAYLLGLSLNDVVLRSQNNRDYEAERHYVNAFEPGADVWLLILRAWYETYAGQWIRLSPIPGGHRSALLLSHDVDWEKSFLPCLEFARIERENNATSTFFIQTKYRDDANSKAFFFEPNLAIVRNLKSGGSSIGSHSVIHSHAFASFETGSGQETYRTYRARSLGFDRATGASVFGEVRVSRELLDGEIPGQQTIAFRAGHLRFPRSLTDVLERSGYRFDSSYTADDVLSNFPYALPRDPDLNEDSDVYEFPVTIEDEEAPGFAQRVPQSLDVILANAENGAVSVALIHTNESRLKAAAEAHLLQQLPADILKTDIVNFAQFWRARDRLQWTITPGKIPSQILLAVQTGESVTGLTFEFPRAISLVDSPGPATVSSDQRHLVLGEVKAGSTATVRIRYRP